VTDITTKVREHYRATGLIDRIAAALSKIAPQGQTLTVAQLAPLDQFHTRGLLATAELAASAGLEPSALVLDLGCGIGGPARYLASTFGCQVTGVDLSPGFVDAAAYLTARCGLSDRVAFQTGDALHPPFDDAEFDAVFLQHVAMNIEDRAALYAQAHRILRKGGRLAVYDLVLRDGDLVYPVPWARDASASFLLSEDDTRRTLEEAGFRAAVWRDDTKIALDWFQAMMAGPPPDVQNPGVLNLGLVAGPDFPAIAGNLARNIRENRAGVLSAVLTRN
jgi:SAM-dependent methyltransferase